MFDTCYVHIGPPKTATTSIQRTLSRNTDLLEADSIHYPRLEVKHQFLVSRFMKDPESFDYNVNHGRAGPEIERHHQEAMSRFETEAERSGCRILVLSSEHLVLLESDDVDALHRYLRTLASDIRVVLYARHPLAAVASNMQELIKNGECRLADFSERTPFTGFKTLIPRWADVFGRQAMVIRAFDRDALIGGDPVDDFLAVIGFSGTSGLQRIESLNESLSAPALLIADALAGIAPKFSEARARTDYLYRIKGPAFVPPEHVLENTKRHARPHLEYLREEWGIELKEPEPKDAASVVFTNEAIHSIALLLNELSPERRRPLPVEPDR
jgi:hypothetical protein